MATSSGGFDRRVRRQSGLRWSDSVGGYEAPGGGDEAASGGDEASEGHG